MAFKATKYQIKNGENSSSKSGFKATKYRSYDPDVAKGWETTNKQSLDIINDYNSRINKSEWLDEEDRKKYRSALDSYIETANLLRGINKTFGEGYSDEDEQKWNDSIASLNKGYDEVNSIYGKYTSGDAFKKAMEDAAAWQKDYDEKMSYNLVAGENEIRYLNAILDLPNEITQLKKDLAILNQVKSDPYGTYRKERESKASRLEALENELAGYMNHFGSEAAIKSLVSEKSAYYTLAKRVQDGARLGGVSNPESEYYDPNFEEYSKLGNSEWWENIGSKTNKNGIAIYDDLKAATLVMNEKWLGKELFSEDMATPKGGIKGYFQGLFGLSEYNDENIDTVNIFREMEDDEISTLAYYLQKDKENGTNLAEQYVGSLRPKLNARMGDKIAATKKTIASQYLFAVEAGIDQYFEGRDALFSGEDYIPTSATQYASGIVRENLADKGILLWYNFKDGKWENEILGSSTGQIFYDALNTTTNMLPSVLTSMAVNTVLPGVGSTVGLGVLGIGAAGNAKAEMLNLGYSKEQANAYGLLVGASEVLLEKILGGIPGLKGGDGIFSSLAQKIFGKIDNTLARVAIAIGGNIDESLEEGLQAVLEPWLKEMATNVDWEAANVDEILYSSLLGYLSSVGFTGLDMAGNKIKYNAALNKHGQDIIDNGGVDALRDLALETYGNMNNVKGSKGVNLASKLGAGQKITAKNVGKLSAFMEDTATSQNENALTQAFAKKGLSKNVATKVAKYIMDSKELSKADIATIEGSQKIQSLIDEVLADPNLEVNDISARLMAARSGVSSVANQTKSETVSKNAPAKENATGGDFEASVEGANLASEEKASPTVKKATVIDSEGNEVEFVPQRFASTESGEMGVETENGKVVATSEVDFGDSAIGLVHQAAVDMSSRIGGFGVDTANVFVRGYDAASGQSAGAYIDGWVSAYKFGAMKNPPPLSALAANQKTAQLTEEQRKTAYNFGRAFGNEKIVSTVTKNDANISKTDSKKKNGRVIFDGERYGKRLNERQKASLKALNFIAEALGVDIYVDKLAKDENGWYDPSDRSIHVDLDAGVEAEALLLFTTSHELNHDIRATLPEKFNTLADAVFEEYNKKFGEHTMQDLIDAKIEFLKEKGDITEEMSEEEAYDLAFEEVICDCLETMLVDSDAITALSKNIYAKDKTLWQRIKDFFARLVARIRAAYADVVPDSEEGQRFRDLGEGAERIKRLWEEAIVELSEVDKTTGEGKVKHSYSSIAYSFFGDENISIKDMESGAYKKTEGYKQYVDQCLNNMRQSVEGFSEKAALKEITDSIDGIVKVAVAMKKAGYDILDSEGGRNIRDSKKRLLFSSLEPNSDYFTSSDISTICDKRINFAEIYDEIVRREDAMGVPKSKRFFNNIDNYFVLHKILADKGLTAPCRQCYVESMRKNLDPMANAFIELMQETDPNNKANKQLYQPSGKNKGELKSNNAKIRENLLEIIEREQYDITADKLTIKMLTTADGLAQLKLQAPLIYEAFNSFYGQSKPKMPKQATPFRFGELAALLTDDKGKIKTGLIKQIMSTGGFRLQSYSDFQIQNFADVLQVIFEAGTLGLNGHAYTKVPAFLDATKGTNLKRNISIFMYKDGGQWKIDRGDSFPYELEDIYDIVDADESGNTGIIAVVQNEDMAAWIMANNNIGYFIPFHKSGVKMGVVRETIVREGGREIKGYSGIKDHTRQQTEVWAKTTADHKANTKVKKGINIYEFWDFDNVDNLSQKELIKKNVMAYIDACNEAGYLPKFREYVMDNGKVLNKVLSYAKELGSVSQDATIDDISFEYSGYRIPYGYYKCLTDFGLFTPDGEASPIERLSLKDYNFKEAVKFFSDAETLRRNEILQQFENGTERAKYRESDMTTAELVEEVQNRRNQVVDEVVSGEYKKKKYSHTADKKATYSERDSDYMDAVNRGDMETAQKMVDEAAKEAGYTVKGLHATNAEFTVFDISKTSDVNYHGRGIYFTNSQRDVENNYENYEGPDPWQKIESEAYELLYDKYGLSYEDTLTSDSEIIDKINECYDEVIAKFKKTLRRITAYLKFDHPLIIGKGETVQDYDISKYDGIIDNHVYENIGHSGMDENTVHYIVLNPANIKSADPVTYDDNGNIIPLSERFNSKNSDIRYQHRATNGMKPRTLLANALETAVSEEEKNLLQTYKDNIDKLNAEQEKLETVMEEVDKIQYNKSLSISDEKMSVATFKRRAKAKAEKNGINAEDVQFKLDRSNKKYIAYAVGHGTILEADKTFRSAEDNAKLKELYAEAKDISTQINAYDRELLRLQAMQPIKDVLKREKAMAYKRATEKAEQRRKESIEKVRESAARTVEKVRETAAKTEAKVKLQKLVLQTSKWISYPGKDDVKCPDILRGPYAEFLKRIDLSSKRLLAGGEPTHNDERVANAMNNLANAIERITNAQNPSVDTDKVLDSGYLDLPVEFVGKLREMAENISKLMVGGDYVINRMSATDVKQLTKLIRTLNHAIKEMSTLYANLRFASVEALGDNSMSFLESMGEAKGENAVTDFVFWDNALPYYAFKRFGEGGESIFEGLMDGQDKLARLAKVIFDFKDKTWTDKESKAWGEDTHTIDLPSGNTLTLTTANAMGIYCLSRRDQGLQHLLGGGTRVVGIKKGAKKATDSRSTLTQEDINAIVASLTDRQKKVALDIQKFMSEVCSEWGNEVSMKRFLTKEFTDPNYYPIESNDENLAAKDPQAQQSDLYRLLNISATKPLAPGANNEVIIRNIFDVFVEHASDMAKLNAYGLALLDYMKWANYREKSVNESGQIKVRGVHKAMIRTYGDKAWSYVLNLIKDVNGRHSDNGDNTFLMNMMRMQKTASVGNNLRVAFLQFTSYPRASLVLSNKSLVLGLTKKPQMEKAKKYCGIALWKSYGFYDTNIARSIEDQLKGTTDIRQKLIELTMKGPEYADAITWGALWNACEYEVAKDTKNKVGSEEFYHEVGLKLREVVYATQVVDSILTRSQIMRSKSGLTQMATAYMSEPTLTANIVMDAGFQFQKEKRISGSAKTAWKKTGKIITKAVGNYCLLQLITSIAESLADAWRDDDEEEFLKKFGEAFGENIVTNLIPFNKIPIISDIADLLLSFFGVGFVSSDNLSTSWMTQAANAVKAWSEVLGEEFGGEKTSKTVYNALYQTAKVISSLTGVSVSGAMREVVAVWNNTAGAIDSSLKIRQYDLTEEEKRNALYKAVLSGDEKEIARLEAEYDDQKDIDAALRKALRENDTRIKEGAEAYNSGDFDTYESIINEIADEGHFDSAFVSDAIKSEAESIKDKKEEIESDSSEKDNDKAYSIYEASDINIAFDNGDTAKANEIIQSLIKTKVANGKTEKEAKTSLRSSMTSYWKPLYLEAYKSGNSFEMARIRKILYSSKLYGSTNDVIEACKNWLKD